MRLPATGESSFWMHGPAELADNDASGARYLGKWAMQHRIARRGVQPTASHEPLEAAGTRTRPSTTPPGAVQILRPCST